MKRASFRFALAAALLAACSSASRPPTQEPPVVGPQAPNAPPPASPSPDAPAKPSAAKTEDVVDTYHGVQVHDAYRWMERGGAAFDAFLDEQDAYARQTLAAIPGRAQLREALGKANRGATRVTVIGFAGSLDAPRIFTLRRAPDDSVAQLYLRDGFDGADRLVFDPRTRDQGDVHYAINYAYPSPDGKHVAFGTSASGSEDATIEIMALGGNAGSKDRDRLLPEKITRSQYASIDWRDNTSFFYWRRSAAVPADDRTAWFKDAATHLHVLGEDPEKELPVISPQMKALGLPPSGFTWVSTFAGSPWALAASTPGTVADIQFFAAPLAKVAPGATPWRRLTTDRDHVTHMVAHGDSLYAYSYAGASRYRLLTFHAKTGTLAKSKVFVAEDRAILSGMTAAQDALYLQYFDGAKTRIERVSYDGKKREVIKLPFDGAFYVWGQSDRPGVGLTGESWTVADRDFYYEPKTGLRELALREPWPDDTSHLLSESVEVKSADGALVPMSIVRRKDTPLDGSAPALLSGYQSYGGVEQPYFWPLGLVWANQGGIRAECHGRGSGNRGKEWHLAGVKHHKEKGVDDFLACAQYLIDHQYTRSARLSVEGTSSGGILVGGAVTKRPELFAAAILRVPVVNLLRFEATEGGAANVPEYGTVAEAQDFQALLASDPYHRLAKDQREGKKYPAILLTAGRHDVRVPAWLPAKFAARAQAVNNGDQPILFRVESEGGHGIGSTRAQAEEEWADLYAFARWQSGVPVASSAK